VLRIGHDFFSDFASLADRTVYITDGYLGVCGAHEIYLNSQARCLAPLRLTGNYGSEVLRGMSTFKPLGVSTDLLHSDLRRGLLDDERFPLDRAASHPVSFAVLKEIPWHLFGIARAGASQITTRTPYLDNDLVALAFRTPVKIRRSSGPAVRLLRGTHSGLARIITDTGILPASRLCSLFRTPWHRTFFKLDYWRNDGLPHWLSPFDSMLSHLDVKATFFGTHRFLHYRRWFQTELARYLRDLITDRQTVGSQLWNRPFLSHIAESHISGRKNYLREINTVLTVATIERLLIGNHV
jgi:asparagine synthase (glutamine-hydrolysing)